MLERWFKFVAIGERDRYGFGTIAEAIEFAAAVNSNRNETYWTPYLLSDRQAADLDLGHRTDALVLRDKLLKLGITLAAPLAQDFPQPHARPRDQDGGRRHAVQVAPHKNRAIGKSPETDLPIPSQSANR
jgi:hypothetical protein